MSVTPLHHNPIKEAVVLAWLRWTAPRPSGLPNLVVLLWFPVLAAVVGVVLVGLGVSGSSTGNYWTEFGTGHDADLLAGQPREIRTDEWLVQSSWIVSQVQQGFPVFNHTLPGGMDSTIQNDLPSWDWSSVFRPHVLGFLFLPLDQGMAVRWWLPLIGLLIAIYVFVVTIVPRRPVLAVFVAISVALSPLIQWWFLPTTIWPVAWAFAALTAILWCLRSSTTWARWTMSAIAAYLTVTMVMSIYVPFMVPAAIAVVIVGIAFLVGHIRALAIGDCDWRIAESAATAPPALATVETASAEPVSVDVVERLGGGRAVLRTLSGIFPLIVSVVAAIVVIGIWAITRAATIHAVLGTVYPGQRLQPTGPVSFDLSVALFAGPFMRSLQDNAAAGLGVNQSEAAVPILTAVFLIPGLIWCVVLGARRRRADWPALGVLVTLALVFAFLQIAHWDRLAHLLLLDRTTDARIRLVFDVLAPIAVALIVERLDAYRTRAPWSVAFWAPALVVGSVAVVYVMLKVGGSNVLDVSHAWKLVVVLLAVGVLLLMRRWATTGALLLLVAALIVGLQVNPVYRGVYDLNDTAVGKDIAAIEAKNPDAQWVGIGGRYATPLLVESGVTAFNGVQTYPPKRMWHEVDPSGRYENEWNRLANVNWVVGAGAPVVTNPYRDQIQVSFDACSRFAQRHVDYVLSEQPIDSACLVAVDDAEQGASDMRIYRVQ